MKGSTDIKPDTIGHDEPLARLVLSPKDIDTTTGYPKDSFISLRINERGISFLRPELMGKTAFLDKGFERAQLYSRGAKKKRQEFVGWMEGRADEIRELAPDIIRYAVDEPATSPEHVTIEFHKNGEAVRGIVTDAEIMDILDELFHLLKFVKI